VLPARRRLSFVLFTSSTFSHSQAPFFMDAGSNLLTANFLGFFISFIMSLKYGLNEAAQGCLLSSIPVKALNLFADQDRIQLETSFVPSHNRRPIPLSPSPCHAPPPKVPQAPPRPPHRRSVPLPIHSQLTVPAIALYRALITQCRNLPLPAPSRASLSNVVRNRFRTPRPQRLRLALAFHAGYAALALLDASAAGCTRSAARVADLLARAPDALKLPPRPLPRPNRARLKRRGTHGPVAPHERDPPPERRFLALFPRLASPLPGAGGAPRRRRVPRMVSANRVPFLRVHRRQPASLSRALTRLQRRETRVHAARARAWGEAVPVAAAEDEWDALVARAGLRAGRAERERGFADEALDGARRADQDVRDMYRARQEMIDRMDEIVRVEVKLAKREKRQRKAQRKAERAKLTALATMAM
jgi:hypothetical protein